MSVQALSPHRVQWFIGVFGAPRLSDSCGGRPLDSQDLTVTKRESRRLDRLSGDLRAPCSRIRLGPDRACLGSLQSALLQSQRIPRQPQTSPDNHHDKDNQTRRHQPPGRR